MITLQRLEVLAALARHGTMTAAGEALGYGQPTISHHLAQLEKEAGAPLLQSVGRGVRLTPAGALLAQRAEEILTAVRRAEREVRASVGLEEGVVRLATFPSATATLVPAALSLLGRRTGIEVQLIDAEPPEALALLRSGEVDVALSFGFASDPEQADAGPDLSCFDLLDDPVQLITPADDPRRALSEHHESRWLSGCERCRGELIELCANHGFEPSLDYASDDYVAIQNLVAKRVGVTTLPQLALDAYCHPEILATPIAGVARQIRAHTFGTSAPTPAIAAVITTLTQVAADWR